MIAVIPLRSVEQARHAVRRLSVAFAEIETKFLDVSGYSDAEKLESTAMWLNAVFASVYEC